MGHFLMRKVTLGHEIESEVGFALTIRTGHVVESEAAFSAVVLLLILNCGSSSCQVLTNYSFFLLLSKGNL